jgi:hypothetical protein
MINDLPAGIIHLIVFAHHLFVPLNVGGNRLQPPALLKDIIGIGG